MTAGGPRRASFPQGCGPGQIEPLALSPSLSPSRGPSLSLSLSLSPSLSFRHGGAPGRTLSFFSSSAGASSSMRTLERATFDDATFEVTPIIVAGAKPAEQVRCDGSEAPAHSQSVGSQHTREKVA